MASPPIAHKDGELTGCKIVWLLRQDKNALREFERLLNALRSILPKEYVTLLDPYYLHVTVVGGVNENVRPADLPEGSTLRKGVDHVYEQLFVPGNDGGSTTYEFEVTGYLMDEKIFAVVLAPMSDKAAQELTQSRDAIANHLRLRHPDHGKAKPHISLGYPLGPFPEENRKQVEEVLDASIKTMSGLTVWLTVACLCTVHNKETFTSTTQVSIPFTRQRPPSPCTSAEEMT